MGTKSLISLREPYPADTLHPAMLHKYIRKLMLTPDEFMELLKECCCPPLNARQFLTEFY